MDDYEVPELILLSDLHLGAERGRGLFRADSELAAFLHWITEETGPARVVIAGDFLDFLVPREGEETVPAFDPLGAAARAMAVVEHHPEVFDALARLAHSPRHELWILNGNHDPELLLPDVREVLDRRLGVASPPASSLRWRTEGEAVDFQVGSARVLVAHGDCFDGWNRIEYGRLRTAANRLSYGFSRPDEHEYEPPLGTRLVVEHVLRLRSPYPWVDALKPEREAVFPILSQFLSFTEKRAFLGAIKRALLSLPESFWGRLARKSSPARLVRGSEEDSPKARLQFWLQEEEKLVRSSEELGKDLIPRLRRASAEDGCFDLSAPDVCARWVPLLLERGADLVVLGHTHSAKALTLEKGLYLNSGTWGRLLSLPGSATPDEEWQGFLADLRAGCDLGEARPTWVRVEQETRGTWASLMGWEGGAAMARASFRFEAESRHWQREG
ncbi:MAG TPA: metallophosphoesterase [Thermoanaerobaculia bacterium]|nr:metallophosphoesterase [Thermoanaerobaculia bacterium]